MTALLIPRLDPSVPLFSPIGSNFQGVAARDLGALGTAGDGWDAAFSVPAGRVDEDQGSLGEFDSILAGADFAAGDFYGAYHAPVDASLPGFTSQGDSLIDPVVNPSQVAGQPVITPQPGPVTPPPPPPAPASGGGGGGGGGGDGCDIIDCRCIEGDEPGCNVQ